nr:transposase [Myxococcus sp. AB036A]
MDETGFLKKGDKSVGVARQYTATAGKIENARGGVFLSYATPRGHALVDRELCLPVAWTQDAAHRDAGGIPDDADFESKPALAQGLLQRALASGLKQAWVVGDEVYRRDSTLRHFLEGLRQRSVLRRNIGVCCCGVPRIASSDAIDAWCAPSPGFLAPL